MPRITFKHLIWGAIAAAVFLSAGCSTKAYQHYLAARAEYDQCVKRVGSSRDQCVTEREALQGAVGAYEREAKGNQWWRSEIKEVRKQEPLSAYDRK